MNDQIFEDIQSITARVLGVDTQEVTKESNIFDDLGADSLDSVELIMEVEKHFSISIPDEVVEGMKTIGDVYNHVANKRSKI